MEHAFTKAQRRLLLQLLGFQDVSTETTQVQESESRTRTLIESLQLVLERKGLATPEEFAGAKAEIETRNAVNQTLDPVRGAPLDEAKELLREFFDNAPPEDEER